MAKVTQLKRESWDLAPGSLGLTPTFNVGATPHPQAPPQKGHCS